MNIKIIIFDCDKTLWNHYDVTILKRPFKKINDVVIDANNEVIKLNVGVNDCFKFLKEKDIKIAIASFNIPEAVIDILKLFGLLNLIDYLIIEYHPYKDRMIQKIIKMASIDMGIKIRFNDVVFVDDNKWTVNYVAERIPGIKIIHYGRDINDFIELSKMLGFK